MRKTNKKQIKTTTKQKVGLILFGIFLALVTIELGLRIGGFVVSSYQRTKNKEGFDADYRILCLGESTTAMGGEYSWPEQLEVILNNRSSKIKFKVFNEGIGGTNTAFILSRLDNNLKKYKPNMVITMMGINDGNLSIRYEKNLKVKLILFIKDLRIYKISNFLFSAWRNKLTNKKNKEKEESYLFDENIKRDEIKYSELGKVYKAQGRLENSEKMFKKVIEINPRNYTALIYLSEVYIMKNMFEEAEISIKKAAEIKPDLEELYIILGRIYYLQGQLDKAEKSYTKAIEIGTESEEAYNALSKIYLMKGISNDEIEKFYKNHRLPFEVKGDNNLTIKSTIKYHYQKLYEKLKKKGIKYIAVQYPTLNINELKEMFKGDEDIIFVSNEENFKEALETGKYGDYFIDHITNSFGHATFKGNKLIAENVANVILDELGIN